MSEPRGGPGEKPAQSSSKERHVLDACTRRDFDALTQLAESRGGFLSDDLRRQAWPILLGLPLEGAEADYGHCNELQPHNEEHQVKLDVDRAFVHYPNHQNEAEEERQRRELFDLIVEVLRRYPYLHYFQGFHDICQVFLLVLAPRQRVPAVARLCALRIRDFMLPTMEASVAQLELIPDILRAVDPALWAHLSQTRPFFALSGTLTMYAHDVQSLGEIARLFDVLLAREPVFSVYMFVAIVRSRRDELFETPASEPEMLHSILSKLPRSLDLDALIASAVRLSAAHPPESLRSWRSISAASALKTARQPRACAAQSMGQGEHFFRQQAEELERARRRRKQREMLIATLFKYRRPMRALGFALAVGIVAFWLRRPGPAAFLASMFPQWFVSR